MIKTFWWDKLKERVHKKKLDLEGRAVLKFIGIN
jgi:hypothetical protein